MNQEYKIIQALKEKGWYMEKTPNGLYHTHYQGTHTDLIVHLNIINLHLSMVLAIVYLPLKVERQKIDAVARFLNELNLSTFFGSYEMDYNIGEIAFRTGIYYFNTDFQMPMVTNCLYAASYYADRDYPAIKEVIQE